MIDVAGVRIGGLSIGGIETCIDLPGWKIALDVGRCPAEVVARPTVLFTHAHIDHMGGVARHAAMRALVGMPPPTYVVPPANADAFRALFDAWRRLDQSDLAYELVPLGPGGEHELAQGLVARPFASVHRVPTQGYAIWSRHHKLRAEYRGLAPEEIRRLRVEEGVEVTEPIERAELAFTGDTRIEVVERESVVREARILVLEVTFLDSRVTVEQCRAKGHVHLDEVIERADAFQNEALVFTHFSARYRRNEIVELLDRRLPPSLRERVTPFLFGFS